MSRWYRAYEGTVTDAKLGEAALIADVSRSVAIAAWHCLLESAACKNNCGSYDTTPRRVAVILCEPPAKIDALFAAFEELELIGNGAIWAWQKRQFQSDDSKERVAKHREKKRQETADNGERNADVTPCNADVTPPYTETDTETEVTPIAPLEGGRRGKTFIPADWKAPPVSELPPRSRACAEQWTEASYETEAEGFLLYWRAERKMKADWSGTWANRIITRNSAVMRDQKYGNAAPETVKPMSAEQSKAYAERYAAQLEAEGRKREAADYRRRYSVSVGEVAAKIVRTA